VAVGLGHRLQLSVNGMKKDSAAPFQSPAWPAESPIMLLGLLSSTPAWPGSWTSSAKGLTEPGAGELSLQGTMLLPDQWCVHRKALGLSQGPWLVC
jgi:hypothetical protein